MDKVSKTVLELVVQLQEMHRMTQSGIFVVWNAFCKILELLEKDIEDQIAAMRPDLLSFYKAEVGGIFQVYKRQKLTTEYQLIRLLKKHHGLVMPSAIELGKHFSECKVRGKEGVLEEPVEAFVVPFTQSLQQMYNSKELRSYLENPYPQSTDGYIQNVKDGRIFQNHPVFQCHPNGLLVQLYEDDVELCNPLGANTKKHKTTNIYWTLLNFPDHVRSNLKSINMCALAKSTDVKEFGFEEVLSDFIQCLVKLETSGLEIVIDGETKIIHGALISVNGDGLAMNFLGGFKEGIGFAHKPCRNCLIAKNEIATLFIEGKAPLREKGTHAKQLQDLATAQTVKERENLSIEYGICNESVLSKIPNFDPTKSLPQDLMHNLCEGVMDVEMKSLIFHLIEVKGLFNYENLRDELENFPYPKQFSGDKPSPIERAHIVSGNLRQSAAQSITLANILPFVLAPFANDDAAPYIENFVLLCNITNLLLAYKVKRSKMSMIRFMIQVHHTRFKFLYPDTSITPKFHFLLHACSVIEDYGPTRITWCMRYESRNAWFKRVAQSTNNKKNIVKTLANRFQIRRCLDLGLGDPEAVILAENEFNAEISSVVDLKTYVLGKVIADTFGFDINNENCNKVSAASSIFLKNFELSQNSFILLKIPDDNNHPQFGKISAIFVHEMICLFVVNVMKTVVFDQLRNAYEVEFTENIVCVKSDSLPGLHDLPFIEMHQKKFVIALYYDFIEFVG